jgi:drug/metabolite transporter (DMT)-like permease
MLDGAVLTRAIWPRRRVTWLGVAFVVLAGVGGILVGLAPANVNLAVHGAGALLQVPGAVHPKTPVASRMSERSS